ncbi:MAG: hybrid sensor histidine kinase/response regulator, partial [Elusimicrobia bacterium]|nr:hybrid sensor histidine kinase/response regulator [Elusimicrobiota bacterium]
HDFNTILTIVGSALQCAEEEIDGAAPVSKVVAAGRRAVARGAGLAAQLTAFGRRHDAGSGATDLNAVVRETAAMLAGILPSGVVLELGLDEGLPPAAIEKGHAEQVVMNLLINARDAMPAGGVVRVETAREAPHGNGARPGAALRVIDHGHGMDRAVIKRLSEPFFTTKPRGKGTGLGLATVFGIVEEARGRVEVDSAPGAGSRFTVHFPAA